MAATPLTSCQQRLPRRPRQRKDLRASKVDEHNRTQPVCFRPGLGRTQQSNALLYFLSLFVLVGAMEFGHGWSCPKRRVNEVEAPHWRPCKKRRVGEGEAPESMVIALKDKVEWYVGPRDEIPPGAYFDPLRIEPCNSSATVAARDIRIVIYVLDNSLVDKVVTYCRNDPKFKTAVVVGGSPAQGKKAAHGGTKYSRARRKYFNRLPYPTYMKGVGKEFATDFVRKLEEEFLKVPKDAMPTDLDRIIIGHSNGGPAVFSMFSVCPEYFRHVIMLDPAVCDAPMRRLMEQAYPGNAKSSDSDEYDTARMFKKVWNSKSDSKCDPDGDYDEFYKLLQTHAGPLSNEVHKQLEIVKTHWEMLIKSLTKRQKSKHIDPYTLGDETPVKKALWQKVKNEMWNNQMIDDLTKSYSSLPSSDCHARSVIIVYGRELPRPADNSETDNAFDWIPFAAPVFAAQLMQKQLRHLEVKLIDVKGGHCSMLVDGKGIEQALKACFNSGL